MFGLMTRDLAEIKKICDESRSFFWDAARSWGQSGRESGGNWGEAGCFSTILQNNCDWWWNDNNVRKIFKKNDEFEVSWKA